MENFPDPDVQKKIYDLIVKNPGVYLSKIAELLNMKISTVEYYLLSMERDKIITLVKEGGIDRYYSKKRKVGIQEKRTSDIREKIYTLIEQNPGLHLSKIAETLDMRISLAEYHLKYMEKHNEITAVKDGSYYKRYYIASSKVGDQEKKLIALLRQEVPLKIILFLLKHPHAKYSELQEHLGMYGSLLSYHLNKLVTSEIIDAPTYEQKGYSLRNRKEIVQFLEKYRLNALMESFKDVWADLDYYNRRDSTDKKSPLMFFGKEKSAS